MGNFICFGFNSFFLPAPTHALFTLASFRILSTDWRPFKRARATRHFLSILPSDAYKAGHVLLIIDHLIGMERKFMNGSDIFFMCLSYSESCNKLYYSIVVSPRSQSCYFLLDLPLFL
jgi:hypothetical protein